MKSKMSSDTISDLSSIQSDFPFELSEQAPLLILDSVITIVVHGRKFSG